MKTQSGDSYGEQRERARKTIQAWPEYLRRPLNGRVSGMPTSTGNPSKPLGGNGINKRADGGRDIE